MHTLVCSAVLFANVVVARTENDPADNTAASSAPSAVTPKIDTKPTPGDGALLAAVLQLERALGDADPKSRPQSTGDAVRALGTLNDARAIPVLLRLSKSTEAPLRLSALGAMGAYLDDERVRARLEETLAPNTPVEDAAVALPALLEAARKFPGAKSVPCPEKAACVDDATLLQALLQDSVASDRSVAVDAVAALKDPRAIPYLWRLSGTPETKLRTSALHGLALQASEAKAKERLLEVLADQGAGPEDQGASADRSLAADALAHVDGDDVTKALLAAREHEKVDANKQALEAVLGKRAPTELASLLEEEKRRLAEQADAPQAFDTQMRIALAGVAGVGAAIGGAAASSVVADQIAPGSGSCYGAWGACAGGASAGAIGWFGLGDRRVDGAQVALAATSSAWGAWAGVLVPPTIGPSATKDVRHMVYSAAAGQLIGLTAGTVGALVAHPSGEDVAEMNAVILGANALTAGVLLSLPPSPDARPLWGSLIGATIVGSVAGAALSSELKLDTPALIATGEDGAVGFGVGLFAGLAVYPYDTTAPFRVAGISLLGAGAGLATGLALGQAKLEPSAGGMIYEGWAALAGGAAGLGGGLFLDAVAFPTRSSATNWFGAAAVGVALGAASTGFFPDGIPQDSGDLLLQPLFVGFGLYHGAALAATAGLDPRYVGAAALLTPALASAGIAYGAPYIHASTGDVLMVASTMGFSAYLSSMALLSANGHGVKVPNYGWVLWTSLAMDAGVAGGIALDLTNVDHVGWRTTYVAAVAAGTTLVISLPGALVAQSTKGAVQVSDVLLASSLLGVGVGFATMPLIDFRIAPDWGLSVRPTDAKDAPKTAMLLDVKPTMVAMQPGKDGEVPLGAGFIARF